MNVNREKLKDALINTFPFNELDNDPYRKERNKNGKEYHQVYGSHQPVRGDLGKIDLRSMELTKCKKYDWLQIILDHGDQPPEHQNYQSEW